LCKIDLGRVVLSGSGSGQATEVRRSHLRIVREERSDLQIECESATTGVQPRKRNELNKRLPPEGKASHLAEIEARIVADDARRIRVLSAWRPLYFIAGSPRSAGEKAAPSGLWVGRIIDTVAALKAENLTSRLDDINCGHRDTPETRASKYAIKVYRLAADGDPIAVAKAVADGMREDSPTSKTRVFRKHFEEMLRWRIMLGIFRAEWRRFSLAELERELDCLSVLEPTAPTA
jgi:hypothetical protein